MKKVALCGLLVISLGALGIILLDGQESNATDFTNSSLPIDNTTILIEEEKEEDEYNVTRATSISEITVITIIGPRCASRLYTQIP